MRHGPHSSIAIVLVSAVAAVATVAGVGCRNGSAEASAGVDASAAAAPEGPDPLCIVRPSAVPEETITIAGKTWQRKGTTLSLQGADADDEFVVGQITDVKDYSADNAVNLMTFRAWMKSEGVDAVVVTGDLGESQDSIEKVLRDLAILEVPVLAVIGNRECRDHYDGAVKAAQRDFKNIVNMNQIRVVNTDDVSLVSLPGYHNPSYLHCANGCAYSKDDVIGLAAVARDATAAVRALVAHGPPRQSGPLAIDRMQPENANMGDPDLAAILKQDASLFPFGLFGNTPEAGGYGTNLDGSTRVAAETFADALYLNPGPADAVRWGMNDGSESVGMAGLMKFKGKQAMYKIFRMKAGARAAPATAPSVAGGATPPAAAAPSVK